MPIEDTEVYKQFSEIADEIWAIVSTWDYFAKDTVGRQLVRAIDGVPANMVEGDARGSDPDAIRFFRYARASARESRNRLRRAEGRALIDHDTASRLIAGIEVAVRSLNGIIGFRKKAKSAVRETVLHYGGDDPFTDPI